MKNVKKLFSFLLVLCTLFLSITSCILNTNAEQIEANVDGQEVRIRSGAGTNYSILGYISTGEKVYLTSTKLTKGSGCSAGWYNILYNNKSGYICASYVNVPGIGTVKEYGLPWTSPKKAIFGGASFISGDYLSTGQNTSYLKKFNVNPNSIYGQNQHQYMANLVAPKSEAENSYLSYKENNLLSLPLHFEIPIFNNMPEKTTHPEGGAITGGQTKVTDKEFEKKLDAEGFNETYKIWLRALHEKYPNWTFSALQTNLDFNATVSIQQLVGSIQKSYCAKCIAQPEINTEGNWYRATNETVAYYLDPRNFLQEQTILMFEDLSYNEIYKEETVKSILKGTFMDGNDHVDNLSYSSIFVEAGKTYNVNPVYLASLARQEVGTKQGLTTSGERFDYLGQTYEGFYNFYNIGAYSSADNPAKAGLVYASQGAKKNEEGIYVGNINENSKPVTQPEEPEVVVIPTATHLSNMKLNKKGNYVTNVALNTTVGSLKSLTVGSELTFKKENGTVLGNTEKLTTGSTITFANGETTTIVIYGDLTGDGEVDSADLLRMRQQLLGKVTLSGAYLEAAHVYTTSGKIDSSDLLRLRQHLLGKTYINQA